MIHKKSTRHHDFEWSHFITLAKRRFKKKYKKNIKATEIKKIWLDWLEYWIIEGVLNGNMVKIDRYSTIQIVGRSILEDKRVFKMLINGKSMGRNGTMKNAEFGSKRRDFIYKIEYENSLAGDKKLYFKADRAFSRRVHEALLNNNIYYKIEYAN